MTGSLAGQSVKVTGELVIGRENADLTIEDPEVSRRHVAVRLQSGQLEVEDLGSANGTFVNGSRIEGPVTVGGGAKIRVGMTEFEVRGVLPPRAEKHAQPGASPIADPQATRATPIPDPQVTRATPIPEPQVTRAAPIVDPQTTRARAIPDPQTTRARAIPDPQTTQARAIPDPQTTQARAIPDPQTTQARAIPDPQTTKAHGVADPQVTQARSVPADLAKPQASSESVLDASPPVAPPARGSSKDVAAQVGAFSPQARRRSRGLASRSWVPTVASFGTAVAAAAALIVYFAVHGIPG